MCVPALRRINGLSSLSACMASPPHSPHADQTIPAFTTEHVARLFFSPMKPAMTPETLSRAMPDLGLSFWTHEKQPLSPKTAKRVCRSHEGRRVMAVIPSMERAEARKTPRVSGLEAEATLKEETSSKALLEVLLHKVGKLDRKVKEHEELLTVVKTEKDLYYPLGLTRRHAVLNLLACLLDYLNHVFCQNLHQRGFNDFVGRGKPFSIRQDISYFKCWYYVHKELQHRSSQTIQDFWAEKIGYKGNNSSVDNKEWKVIGTTESTHLAQVINKVMEEAAEAVIQLIGGDKGITTQKFQLVMGFYISLDRVGRNFGIHLLQNLFGIGGESSKRYIQPPDPFSHIDKDFVIDKNLCAKGMLILEDITGNIDQLEEPECVKEVVEWFATWLLLECKKNCAPKVDGMREEARWIWVEAFKRHMWYYPERGWYLDESSNSWWMADEEKWWYYDGAQWNVADKV